MGLAQTYMVELTTLSQALNEVRTRALGRLAEEAMHVGADAVVEVNTRAGESSLDTGTVSLEHTVFGTAVSRDGSRRDSRPGSSQHGIGQQQGSQQGSSQRGSSQHGSSQHGSGRPVLTELSVADFSKLVRGGFEPLGIVAWSSVFFASYNYGPGMVGGGMMSVGATQNFELREFTRAFYNARESVMGELNAQASAIGASGIVGVQIGHRAVPHTLQGGMNTRERSGLMVTFNAIGTAILQIEEATLYPARDDDRPDSLNRHRNDSPALSWSPPHHDRPDSLSGPPSDNPNPSPLPPPPFPLPTTIDLTS